jgi:DNA-binding HxlR family transcriptional regulator
MSGKTYGQYCPIANALDMIGERWTLLIVRDLLLGPKRFSDLREGLPGIGTNILTDRLKGLEEAGVIGRRVLPPPAASAVYELTEYGRQLDAPIQALAMWGGQTLGRRTPELTLSRDSLVLTMRGLARRLPPATYAFELTDAPLPEPALLRVEPAGGASLAPGGHADVTLRLDVDTLFALAGGHLTLSDALVDERLQLSGSREALALLGV